MAAESQTLVNNPNFGTTGKVLLVLANLANDVELESDNMALMKATLLSARIRKIEKTLEESDLDPSLSIEAYAERNKIIIGELEKTPATKAQALKAHELADPLLSQVGDSNKTRNELSKEFAEHKARWLKQIKDVLELIDALDTPEKQQEKAQSSEIVGTLSTLEKNRSGFGTKTDKYFTGREHLRKALELLVSNISGFLTAAQKDKIAEIITLDTGRSIKGPAAPAA